jgi:DNA repair protein RecO (recombination protein O)
MIAQTQGIVLNYIKYKESSIIVKIYTQKYGLKSFIVNGIRSKKAKKSIGHFQPLTLLEIQLYYNENRELLRLSDAKIMESTPSISQNIVKSTIALFITEVLSKTLTYEQLENAPLYHFIKSSVFALEKLSHSIEDFHLLFLIKYSTYLGLNLMSPDQITEVQLSGLQKKYLDSLIDCNYEQLMIKKDKLVSGADRKDCLEAVLSHFKNHLEGLKEIKSLRVLHQVFH